MPINPALLVEMAIVAVGFAVWAAAFGGALLWTRPRDIQPCPPTQEFGGPEPPAVVSLITGGWELTEDAVESTLIDLAARRILEFRQPVNDPAHTTIHVRVPHPGGLTPYERKVFDRVAELAVGGVIPLTAVTFRNKHQAESWTKRINESIVEDARRRGLSQRRFSPTIVTALTLAAGIPALLTGLAVALYMMRVDDREWTVIGMAVIVVWTGLSGLAGRRRGERDTALGREAAARWLGLKAYLHNQESFADLPPAAVAVWDRYLSYGDAVGATHTCSAIIDLGMGNRKRVWSSFGGGWRRVRVRYPRFWRRYGQSPMRLAVKVVIAAAAVVLVNAMAEAPGELLPASAADLAAIIVTVLFLVPLLYGGYTLLLLVADVLTPVTVTGEVLWIELWRSRSGGEDSPPKPWLYYLAVDDGRDDRTVAWACPVEHIGGIRPGQVVTMTARRWTRRVRGIQAHDRASVGRPSI